MRLTSLPSHPQKVISTRPSVANFARFGNTFNKNPNVIDYFEPQAKTEQPKTSFFSSFAPFKRLANGFKNIIEPFKPHNLSDTIMRILALAFTGTVITSFTGLFNLLLIPVHFAVGVTWEVISAFLKGLLSNPNPPPMQEANKTAPPVAEQP